MNLDALVAGIAREEESAAPTPGRFYRIRSGDTLFGVAGRAYGVAGGAARMAAARRINDAHANLRYRDRALTDNGLFPAGRISFSPRFACDPSQAGAADRAPRGHCFATIWLPPVARTITVPAQAPATSLTVGRNVLAEMTAPGTWCEEAAQPGPIVGDDDREPVTDTTRAPYRWVCKLVSVFGVRGGRGAVADGTGFLVDPDTIVTAGHVIDSPDEGIAEHVVVLPGFNKEAPFGSAPLSRKAAPFGAWMVDRRGGRNLFVAPEWHAGRSAEHDYAVIRFRRDQPLRAGDPVEDGWNTVTKGLADVAVANVERQKGGPATPGEILRLLRLHSGRIAVAGYGFDRPCRQLVARGGQTRRFLFPDSSSHNLMESFLDTTAGGSGGPYWIVRPRPKGRRQHILVGLHRGALQMVGPVPDEPLQTATHMVVITPEAWRRIGDPTLMQAL